MILFGNVVATAKKDRTMDEAVCRLEGLMDLSQGHPALAPELAILARLCSAWEGLIPKRDTRRLAWFEIRLDRSRNAPIETAVERLANLFIDYPEPGELAPDLERIATVCEAWAELSASEVMIRHANN